MQESKPTFEAFLDKHEISYWPSSANFIWMFPNKPDEIEKQLRAHNILVRPKRDGSGRVGLRVTLGTKEQVQHLIKHIEQALLAQAE